MGFLFGAAGNYDATQGLPGFMAGSNVGGLQQAQNQSLSAAQQQQSFLNAISGMGGLNQNQANIYSQQQGLANQFQALANGQGPNIAQTQLAQNTGQNMQQQAALMNSARGAQANPGLITRQSAQEGGNLQQQSAGQAAALMAQQQVNAQQQLAAQQGQMANLATVGVGQQQGALSQIGNQNLNYQQMLQNALTQQNAQQVTAQGNQGQIAVQGMKNGQGVLGGILGGIGGVLGLADGGEVPDNGPGTSILSRASKGLTDLGTIVGGGESQQDPLSAGLTQFGQGFGSFLKGPQVNPMAPQMGAMAGLAAGMPQFQSDGGKINGKAKTEGDSQKNDTVPAMLSPGEIVIPRTHVDSADKAAQFLNGLMGWSLSSGRKA